MLLGLLKLCLNKTRAYTIYFTINYVSKLITQSLSGMDVRSSHLGSGASVLPLSHAVYVVSRVGRDVTSFRFILHTDQTRPCVRPIVSGRVCALVLLFDFIGLLATGHGNKICRQR